MSLSSQRILKSDQLIAHYTKVGVSLSTVSIPPIIGSPVESSYGYRSKLTPHFDGPHRKRVMTSIGPIGFRSKWGERIVDVDKCPIATDAINERMSKLRAEISDSIDRGEIDCGKTLLLRDDGKGFVETGHNKVVTEVVSTKNGDKVFEFRAGNFFQTNPSMVPSMVDYVTSVSSRPLVGHKKSLSTFLDFYCGSGLFSICVSSHFERCIGVELNIHSVQEATANALRNGSTNCKFVAGLSATIFKTVTNGNETDVDPLQSVVFCDPPRKGCGKEFLEQLLDFGPARIVYMSCEPASQAKEAKTLIDSGKYELVELQAFDLFPQTRHIECCAVFERVNDVQKNEMK